MRLNYFILFLAVSTAFTQSWETRTYDEARPVLRKARQFFIDKNEYSVDLEFASYTGESSTEPYEKVKGFIHRKGDFLHTLHGSVRTIQDQKVRISIDTIRHIFQIGSPLAMEQSLDIVSREENMAQAIYRVKKLSTSGREKWELQFKSGFELDVYRITLNAAGMPELIEMVMSKEYAIPEKNGIKAKPVARTRILNYKEKPGFTTSEFDLKKYAVFNGTEVKPTASYSSYSIIDTRKAKK